MVITAKPRTCKNGHDTSLPEKRYKCGHCKMCRYQIQLKKNVRRYCKLPVTV